MLGQETVNIKYKPRCKSILFLSIEIILMALPATLFWAYTVYEFKGVTLIGQNNLYYLIIISSGIGLFSLWWLAYSALRSVKRMICKEVPILIKFGVGLGIITSAVLLILSAHITKNNWWAFWVFFCPLLLSLHLLFISKPNTDKNA